jgi:hypothetical protein
MQGTARDDPKAGNGEKERKKEREREFKSFSWIAFSFFGGNCNPE